jgi:hypothetical protein
MFWRPFLRFSSSNKLYFSDISKQSSYQVTLQIEKTKFNYVKENCRWNNFMYAGEPRVFHCWTDSD